MIIFNIVSITSNALLQAWHDVHDVSLEERSMHVPNPCLDQSLASSTHCDVKAGTLSVCQASDAQRRKIPFRPILQKWTLLIWA